jgi:ATP-dependent phosphofructokinase / diphosphate-dependent phosphofructokinase
MARKNAFYAQSGGVTSVINASACGVLETAREHSNDHPPPSEEA